MSIVLITGGSGMIGKAVAAHLISKGYSVRFLLRDKHKTNGSSTFYWNYQSEEIDENAFDNVDYVINLAGATINQRWTFKHKQEIYDSRIMSTNFLFNHIKKNRIKIKKFISVSATGYYGDTTAEKLNENSPSGNDFLAMVCRDWENSAKQFNDIKTPVCILRLGVVMSVKGGFVKGISNLIKKYLGVHLGSGKQFVSWIALSDLCNLFTHTIEKNLVGTYNATASNPMTMEQIDNAIAKFYHRKIWLPNISAKLLKMVLGEMSSMILSSCRTSNEKIKTTGFVFQYEEFDKILNEETRIEN
jgi:uncharacterized protein (TIGR01777 family)